MRIALLLSHAPAPALALARAWRNAGDEVDVVLLDAAAARGRDGHADGAALREVLAAGVAVAVHDDAARRRGLDTAGLLEGLKTVDMDEIADLVAEGADKVVWL